MLVALQNNRQKGKETNTSNLKTLSCHGIKTLAIKDKVVVVWNVSKDSHTSIFQHEHE
jgi:hypothetical protein